MSANHFHPSSYRDPSGFVFQVDGKIYRQVNNIYWEHYEHLMRSGLYHELTAKQYLLPHTEVCENFLADKEWRLTLLPHQLSFTSYPYEWCFEQLKDAALLTLKIVKIAVEKGMILKDATPFNIQFHHGKTIFIDTLSFEKYDASMPWVAYRQFCETFLFPLWLSHYHKMNFQQLLHIYPEGIPIAVADKLMPAKSRFSSAVWLHLMLQKKISRQTSSTQKGSFQFSKKKLLDIIAHLENIILKLDNTTSSTWSDYYRENVNHQDYLEEKKKVVSELLGQIKGNKIVDLGANEGKFSILAAEKNFDVIAIDNDEQSINKLYKKIRDAGIVNIIPLCIDITNPTPAAGFANQERSSFTERTSPNAIMALALVHHLAIGKNMPLPMLAGYFNELAPQLIIEFVSREDEKTKILLQNKKDIYTGYTKKMFESSFEQYFTICTTHAFGNSERYLYLMKRKSQ